MTRRARSPRVLFITDPDAGLERTLDVLEAASAGARGGLGVQIRDKRSKRPDRAWVTRVAERARRLGVPFIVNGDAALAEELGAFGVHGDVTAGRRTWRSMAAHDDEDVRRAVESGVDAILVSPVFETPGKGPARGVAALERARRIAGDALDVVALGGVDASNAPACRAAGADGVAVVRSLYDAPDPGHVAEALLRALDGGLPDR